MNFINPAHTLINAGSTHEHTHGPLTVCPHHVTFAFDLQWTAVVERQPSDHHPPVGHVSVLKSHRQAGFSFKLIVQQSGPGFFSSQFQTLGEGLVYFLKHWKHLCLPGWTAEYTVKLYLCAAAARGLSACVATDFANQETLSISDVGSSIYIRHLCTLEFWEVKTKLHPCAGSTLVYIWISNKIYLI